MNTKDQNEDTKIHKLRSDLFAWLDSKAPTHTELIKWIKGYNIPALGHEDAPHDWIIRAISPAKHKLLFKRTLALRIAHFLREEKPYEKMPTDDKLLYNLFYLCANLKCKQEIAQSLEEVFDFFQKNKYERDIFFSEKKMYNLNAAFREALISNQVSEKYFPFWKTILNQQEPTILRGNILTGFLGVLNMSNDEYPVIDKIGWALKKMAEYFIQTEDEKRHEKFRKLLTRVKEVWNKNKFEGNWDTLLFNQAMKLEWDDWAAARLDKLVIPISEPDINYQRFYIWEIYLPFFEELKFDFKIVSRTNILLEINASKEVAFFLQEVSQSVENNRIATSNKSYEGIKSASNEAFIELVEKFKTNNQAEFAEAIQQARFKVLASRLPEQKQKEAIQHLARHATG